MQIPISTFYYHLSRLRKPDKCSAVRERIKAIYHLHKGRYGYRRITKSLHNEGMIVNHKKVERIMKECNLFSLVRIKKYKSYRGEQGKAAKNILKRNFKAKYPNRKWVTDVSEFKLCGCKRYLSPIMDLYNGEIIHYTLSERPNLYMVTSMLKEATRSIGNMNNKLIIHSDQGWHYRHDTFKIMLKDRGIRQSMSRKGNCYDNAAMESFFAVLKSEFLYLQTFCSINEFSIELGKYIKYYNNERIKIKLNGMSPVKYRLKNCKYNTKTV